MLGGEVDAAGVRMVGGTVSVIDNATRKVVQKITFAIPGVPDEALQPVGVRVTKDRAKPTSRSGRPTGSR